MDWISLVPWAALALAGAAALISFRRTKISDLRARVEELEQDVESLHGRLTKRAQKENMEKARSAHEERSKRRDTIEAEAMAVIEATKAKPAPAATDPEEMKRQLRAQLLVGGRAH